MRYVIYGAGGVGGTIGARLCAAGTEVVLIARGEHGRQIAKSGLKFGSPEGWTIYKVPVVSQPLEIVFTPSDVVVLAMKSQDTGAALDALAPLVDVNVPIVCAQNGVANERRALRRFANVHGMCVMMPAVHLDPGVVHVHAAPRFGTCDVGRFPRGRDGIDEQISLDFTAAGFRSRVCDDIMGRKYAKLVSNLSNVLEAASGNAALRGTIAERARAEARAVFAAARIVATPDDDATSFGRSLADVPGVERPGGSTTQSLARGSGLETNDINGEIVLLGRMHGVPTPTNLMLQRLALRLATERPAPGSISVQELERTIGS